MTDDRDFKRLVRRRMAKTGESYTAARAHFRPPSAADHQRPSVATRDVETFRANIYTRVATDRLSAHLEGHYGVRVTGLTELDVGVFRVDRHQDVSWVARVFPAARPLEEVEGDAEILRFLERSDFAAERCADADAATTLEGQGVLVTEYVPGSNARSDPSEQTMHALGDLVGRMHTLRADGGAMARAAGSWHHVSVRGGGRQEDVAVLLELFADAERRLVADERDLFESLCEELAGIDDCEDLPHAFVHPDPCGANAITSSGAGPVLVDWTGAGRGPRINSLANLIVSSSELRLVDAAIAGYRAHVRLDDEELARLPGALRAFPLILDCWSYLFQGAPLPEVVHRLSVLRDRAEVIAQRARDAFDAGSTASAQRVDSDASQGDGQGRLW